MSFVVNIFTFLGFLFLLMIHRRNIDNIIALELYSEDESEEQSSPAIKPVPKAWFLLSFSFLILGVFLR